MSIILKDINMPASCSVCPIVDEYTNNLCHKVFYCRAANIKVEGIGAFESRAEDCPLVEAPEGHKGHWEERYLEEAPIFLRRRWYCSECGKWQTYGMPRYCPNCGAEMEGDE